jgi:HSP20 family protein
MSDLERRVDEAFAELIHKPWGKVEPSAVWQPAVDLYELPKHYLAVADLPGVDPSKVSVRVEAGRLVIQGSRRFRERLEIGQRVHWERAEGDFLRQLPLLHHVEVSGVRVRFKHGLLLVQVPKRTSPQHPGEHP